MITMKKNIIFTEIIKDFYQFYYDNYQKNYHINIDGFEEKRMWNFYLYDVKRNEKVFLFGIEKDSITQYDCKKRDILKCMAENNFNQYVKMYKEEIKEIENKTIYATGRIKEYDEKIGGYAFCILKKIQGITDWEIIKRNNNPIIFRTEQDAIDGTQAAAEMKL